MATIKCVVVGDCTIGKTCMLITYTSGEFPSDYSPTVFETYTAPVQVEQEAYILTLIDTAGLEAYDTMRPLSYHQTDVFILCFSVDSRDSFENVRKKWFPEVQRCCPFVPLLLVGTKADLRDDPAREETLRGSSQGMVTMEMGKKLAKEIKATKYIECSAKTMQNLKEVFNEAIQAALDPPKSPKACVLL